MLVSLALLSAQLASAPQAAPALLSVPLAFEHHADGGEDVFVARGPGYAIGVDRHGTTMRLSRPGGKGVELRTSFLDAAPTATAEGDRRRSRTVSYYLGNDPRRWRENVPVFERAFARGVWPGIDVVFYGRGGELEYDFVVAPGADPGRIRMRISGAAAPLLAGGELVIDTTGGPVRHRVPIAWQELEDGRTAVEASFRIFADGSIGFELGEYGRTHALVIDPVLVYAALLDGSSADQQARIAVDAQGQAVVAFQTASPDLPLRNAMQPAPGSSIDLFVAKFNAEGSDLIYATYLGGSSSDNPGGVALLPDGSAVIACRTSSLDYPLRAAAFPVFNGLIASGVSVFSPAGALVWSTYYAKPVGTSSTGATDVATDAAGNVVICGTTNSRDNPVHGGAFQTQLAGNNASFVARFDVLGQFLGATYFGNPGSVAPQALDVCVAGNGRIGIGGRVGQPNAIPIVNGFQPAFVGTVGRGDGWLAVFDPTLSNLEYSTYFGGSSDDTTGSAILEPLGIAADAQGRFVVASSTSSSDFPVTMDAFDRTFNGLVDGFVLKVDPNLAGVASLVYSTYVGGAGNDGFSEVAIDAAGNYFLAGWHDSPATMPFPHALQSSTSSPTSHDGLVAVLDSSGGRLRFASPFGRPGAGGGSLHCDGVALGPSGSLYFTGTGPGGRILTTPNAFQTTRTLQTAANFVGRIDLPLASAENYGTGHPGTLGVPALEADPPELGATIDLRAGNSLGAATFGVLLVGSGQGSLPIFGGTILVSGFVDVPIPLPAAGLVLRVSIPGDNSASGTRVFAQTIQFDPGASQSLAFSRGLGLLFGI